MPKTKQTTKPPPSCDAACSPSSIYLQVFGDSDDSETPIPDDAWGEVTWSQDRVFAGDVQYIRADLVNDLLTALEHCLMIPANVLPAYHKLAGFIPENAGSDAPGAKDQANEK